jgi:cyclopropane fatty-acyl-phospholipid synthase-like methyltransferase
LSGAQRVLEIASGSGQHALYFCEQNPSLIWQCSELSESTSGLQMNLNALGKEQFARPITLDVQNPKLVEHALSKAPYDAIYTANSLHIMSWEACLDFFTLVSKALDLGGQFIVYGPFLFSDRETVASNLEFDTWLKERNPLSGIRSFEQICDFLKTLGIEFEVDYEMPANNRLLVFKKTS